MKETVTSDFGLSFIGPLYTLKLEGEGEGGSYTFICISRYISLSLNWL